MNKKLLVIDIIILFGSLISCFIFNSSMDLGLTISQMMGYFAISFSILIFSVVILLIIMIAYYIKKRKNK